MIHNGIWVNIYTSSGTLLGVVENVIGARASRPLNRIGSGSFTVPVPSPGTEYLTRDNIAEVYTTNTLLAANQMIGIFIIKSIQRTVPQNGQAVYEVSGPDLLHELTYRNIGENVIAKSVINFLAASAYGKQTTLTVQANAGNTTVTLDSVTGWVIGDLIDVRLNSNSWHTATITNIAGSVVTMSAAIPTGQQANIGNISRTRILKITLTDATGFSAGAAISVQLYPASANYTTTIANISGLTVTLTDPIPENRSASAGLPCAFPGGFSVLTNDADEGDTNISVVDTTGMVISDPITVALDPAPEYHNTVIDAVAGNVITLATPIPWGRVAPYPYTVRTKAPADDDIDQIMDYAPGSWTNPGGGTPAGSYIVGAWDTVYEALEQARQQGGGHFRIKYTGSIVRELEWRTSRDSSGITLVMPNSALHADMTDTSKGIILDLQEDFSEQQIERITRMYVTGANNLKITGAEPYITPAAGITVSWGSSLIIHSTAESGGAARIERRVTFENIRAEDTTDAAAIQAAIVLFKTAQAKLIALQTQPKYYTVTCITHSAAGIKPYNSIVVNYTGPGITLSSVTLTVLSVDYQMGQDGILYTRLQLTDLANPPAQKLTDAEYVAKAISKTGAAVRHLSSATATAISSSGGGSSGGGVPSQQHHDLLGLLDDDHPQYLREDGGRALTGNLTVSPSVTIDGIDISAHAANPNAHHNQATAGDGIAVSGSQQVSVSLASPSGLEFSSGNLRIADSVAGNGLSIASKVLAINLASPSGLEISSDALRINDTVAGAGLTISSKVLAVGAGNGITVNADDVALTTPGTLSVSSSNNPAGSHTHAVTSSDNPGAATQLLKSNASGHLQLIRLGLNVAPAVPLHVAGATEQLRIEYNGSNYTSFTADSAGTLTVSPTNNLNLYPVGDVVFNPTGKDLLPLNNYDLNIGLLNKKFLTLHAAELWVETLVAQDTIATIGGRILVGPTSTFTRDISGGQSYLFLKHNQPQYGHVMYSEAGGSVEFFGVSGLAVTDITAGFPGFFHVADDYTAFFVVGQTFRIERDGLYSGTYTISEVSYDAVDNETDIKITATLFDLGPPEGLITIAQQGANEFCYLAVVRNMDGSGANAWYAGDAIFNTGGTGSGFIDLYSTAGVLSGSGPTIVGNVRTSTTYNAWAEHWAIGNLNGLYGYGADTYGAAVGKYSSTTSYLTADETNGIRMMRGSTQLARWFANGDMLIGQAAASQNNVWITSGGVQLRTNTTVKVNLQADGDVFIGRDTSAAATTAFAIFNNNQTYNSQSVEAGDIIIGDNSDGKANIFWDQSAGQLNFRGGNTTRAYIDTDGSITAGAGTVVITSTGLYIAGGTAAPVSDTTRRLNFGTTSSVIGSIYGISGVLNAVYMSVASANVIVADSGSGNGITLQGPDFINCGTPVFRTNATSGISRVGINVASGTTPTGVVDIQQNTDDDPIMMFRSSGDVAHGMTTLLPTDVYGLARKVGNADGGLELLGSTEQEIGLLGTAYYTVGDTGKATTANGAIQLHVFKKSGTSATTPSANENLLVVRSGTNARFIVDAEGDIHYDGTANTYDEHDDISLLRAINLSINPAGLIQDEFDRFVGVNREMLASANLVTFNEDGHHFVNLSGIQRLVMGAMWQMHKRIAELENKTKRN